MDLKRTAVIVSLLLSSGCGVAHADYRDGPIIEVDADLRNLCERDSQAVLTGKGLSPYNFTASVWSEVNTIHVKGSWRVDGAKDVAVECRIERGSPARSAVMTVAPPR